MTHKDFAELCPELFTREQLAYIKLRTALGYSALDVVRKCVQAARDKHSVSPAPIHTTNSTTCWCQPHRDTQEPSVIVHNDTDGHGPLLTLQ